MANNNRPWWQDKREAALMLSRILAEYQMRRSKLIKYTPTEKELKEAMRFYMFIQDLVEEKDPNSIKLKEILDSISTVVEEQIKFAGFMDEILGKHPDGKVPNQVLFDAAEKWDVLGYIVEDIVTAIGIKIGKST